MLEKNPQSFNIVSKRVYEMYLSLNSQEFHPSFKKHLEYSIRYFRNDRPIMKLDKAIEHKINFVLKKDVVNFGCQLPTFRFTNAINAKFREQLYYLNIIKHFDMVPIHKLITPVTSQTLNKHLIRPSPPQS